MEVDGSWADANDDARWTQAQSRAPRVRRGALRRGRGSTPPAAFLLGRSPGGPLGRALLGGLSPSELLGGALLGGLLCSLLSGRLFRRRLLGCLLCRPGLLLRGGT